MKFRSDSPHHPYSQVIEEGSWIHNLCVKIDDDDSMLFFKLGHNGRVIWLLRTTRLAVCDFLSSITSDVLAFDGESYHVN